MKVEVLYFDVCPTYKTAEKTLRKVLAEEGIDAEVERVAVSTDEEAKRLRFPGSPTIRLDGHDLFPAPEREDWRLGCRVYATPEGLRGSPTAGMIEKALAMKEGYDADRDLWGRSREAPGGRSAACGGTTKQGVRGRAFARSDKHTPKGT